MTKYKLGEEEGGEEGDDALSQLPAAAQVNVRDAFVAPRGERHVAAGCCSTLRLSISQAHCHVNLLLCAGTRFMCGIAGSHCLACRSCECLPQATCQLTANYSRVELRILAHVSGKHFYPY